MRLNKHIIFILQLFVLLLITAANLYSSEIQSLSYPVEIIIPVRDGSFLAADLYCSDTNSAKPVILIQTPYNKIPMRTLFLLDRKYTEFQLPVDTTEYNYVVMDWRGFYGSKDVAKAGYDRGLDGYDAVEWIAAQRWCSGKVGTWGASALGMIQFQTAFQKPPHLVCSVPIVKDYKTKYSDYFYGGDFRKEHTEALIELGFFTSTDLILSHPDNDIYWKYIENQSDTPEKVNVPMLLIGGWFDMYSSDVIRAFEDLRERSADSVRSKDMLIMGPWIHGEVGKMRQGILDFDNAANIPFEFTKSFFQSFLLGKGEWINSSPVLYYQMGDNDWYFAESWKNMPRKYDTLYFHGNILSPEKYPVTKAEPPPDTIIFDPGNPAPTLGGERFTLDKTQPLGPCDISDSIENRGDVLVYSTEVLTNDIKLTGKLIVKLYLSSNCKDTDIGARLCDVYPDGKSIIIRQAIKRMRFRESLSNEKLMTPGEIYPVEIEFDDLAITFKAGHSLRIDLNSSDYPIFDLNLNNGDDMYKAGDTITATNLIYHSYSHPSMVIIPNDIPTSINEYEEESGRILLSPNPSTGLISIKLNLQMPGNVQLEIFDIFGQKVITENININSQGDNIINKDYSNLSEGIYFIRIKSKCRSYFSKFIISK
ncbi:MAG: CocE/NonD family hydrolase [Bacteroidota bacterium]|nr:CocE/NonD family hydrolase [Bacteroidota bacterium]